MKVKALSLFSVFICLMPLNTYASVKIDLDSSLSNCVKISKDKDRLACFDKLTQRNVESSSAEKIRDKLISKTTPAKLDKAIPSQSINNFSKQHLKTTLEETGPESITATISKVKKLIRGQWVINLENGQKWQQKDSNKIKLRVGDIIHLKK